MKILIMGLPGSGKTYLADSGFLYKVGVRNFGSLKILEEVALGTGVSFLCGIKVFDQEGTLLIDKKMKNTLQAVSKHKYCDVLEGFGDSDITYNLSFNLINSIVKELSSLTTMNTTQGEFLTQLGILERAEILSKKMLFSEKADIYFRIKRLIDKNQMGELFKVMLITEPKNKFKLGF